MFFFVVDRSTCAECTAAGHQHAATFSCADDGCCLKAVCDGHARVHVMWNHILVPLQSVVPEESRAISEDCASAAWSSATRCRDHVIPDGVLKFSCTQCARLVCALCLADHVGHEVKNLTSDPGVFKCTVAAQHRILLDLLEFAVEKLRSATAVEDAAVPLRAHTKTYRSFVESCIETTTRSLMEVDMGMAMLAVDASGFPVDVQIAVKAQCVASLQQVLMSARGVSASMSQLRHVPGEPVMVMDEAASLVAVADVFDAQCCLMTGTVLHGIHEWDATPSLCFVTMPVSVSAEPFTFVDHNLTTLEQSVSSVGQQLRGSITEFALVRNVCPEVFGTTRLHACIARYHFDSGKAKVCIISEDNTKVKWIATMSQDGIRDFRAACTSNGDIWIGVCGWMEKRMHGSRHFLHVMKKSLTDMSKTCDTVLSQVNGYLPRWTPVVGKQNSLLSPAGLAFSDNEDCIDRVAVADGGNERLVVFDLASKEVVYEKFLGFGSAVSGVCAFKDGWLVSRKMKADIVFVRPGDDALVFRVACGLCAVSKIRVASSTVVIAQVEEHGEGGVRLVGLSCKSVPVGTGAHWPLWSV